MPFSYQASLSKQNVIKLAGSWKVKSGRNRDDHLTLLGLSTVNQRYLTWGFMHGFQSVLNLLYTKLWILNDLAGAILFLWLWSILTQKRLRSTDLDNQT